METPKIGKLAAESEHRDAIHVAIAPVVAGESLNPADHVGFAIGDATIIFRESEKVEPIGIVDPYLRKPIRAGDRFFLFLYPGTVTSLRHEWTHPAFREPDVIPESEAYIRRFADKMDTPYDDVLAGYFRGDDRPWNIPAEFWFHLERVTGKHVNEEDRDVFFSCYC